MTEQAAEKLKNRYVLMRNSSREVEEEGEKRLAIPITVRQLEAVVRISESLAKMALQPFVTDANVEEALRIFQVNVVPCVPMMHSKIKGNIGHARFLVICYRVHYVGLHPLCGALRGP